MVGKFACCVKPPSLRKFKRYKTLSNRHNDRIPLSNIRELQKDSTNKYRRSSEEIFFIPFLVCQAFLVIIVATADILFMTLFSFTSLKYTLVFRVSNASEWLNQPAICPFSNALKLSIWNVSKI